MPDVSSLVLNVKSDSVEKSASRLDRLTRSATKAERSQVGLATATGRTATASAGAATSTHTQATAHIEATAATQAQTGATAALGASLKTLVGPLVLVTGSLLATKKAFTSTVDIQDFRAQLKTATGSIEDAGEAFDQLEEFASETPFALEQSLEAFIKLTNLGLTPSKEALRSYGNTASAMGKSLNQMIEAVADATTGEFERLKEFGIKSKSEGDKVSFTFRGVTNTIGKNAAEIEGYLMALGENEFAGAMADRMDTLGGKASNFGDAWESLWRTISEDTPIGEAIEDTTEKGIKALEALETKVKQLAGVETRNLNELVDAYDRANARIEKGASLQGANLITPGASFAIQQGSNLSAAQGALQRAEIGLADFSETEITLARTQNALVKLQETENSLADSSQRRMFESEGQYQSRLSNINTERVAVAEKISETEIEIDRLTRLVEMNKAYGEAIKEISVASKERREEEEKVATKQAAGGEGNKEFQRLISQLQTEEETIEASYKKRIEIIRENTLESSQMRLALETRAGEIRNAALLKIENKRVKETSEIQRQQFENFQQTSLLTATLVGQLSDMAEEGTATQKALFIAQKGISIAQAIVNTELAATRALAEGGFFAGVSMATIIRTLGYASVGLMAGQTVGSFAGGGIIPGNSYTGDQLTANVNSNEMILNGQQQARLFQIANNKVETTSGNSGINVTVENYGSSEISVEQVSENDVRIIARETAKEIVRSDAPTIIAADIQRPNSRTSRSLSQHTKTERRR